MTAFFTLLFLGVLGTGIYYFFRQVGFIDYYKEHVLTKSEKDACNCRSSGTALKFKEINVLLKSINNSISKLKSEQEILKKNIEDMQSNAKIITPPPTEHTPEPGQ